MSIFDFFKKEPSLEEKQKQLESLKKELEPEVIREEPTVKVVDLTIPNKDNPSQGYFELDWNTEFVDQLISSGYKGKTDEEIVESWFNDLCRSISNEDLD